MEILLLEQEHLVERQIRRVLKSNLIIKLIKEDKQTELQLALEELLELQQQVQLGQGLLVIQVLEPLRVQEQELLVLELQVLQPTDELAQEQQRLIKGQLVLVLDRDLLLHKEDLLALVQDPDLQLRKEGQLVLVLGQDPLLLKEEVPVLLLAQDLRRTDLLEQEVEELELEVQVDQQLLEKEDKP